MFGKRQKRRKLDFDRCTSSDDCFGNSCCDTFDLTKYIDSPTVSVLDIQIVNVNNSLPRVFPNELISLMTAYLGYFAATSLDIVDTILRQCRRFSEQHRPYAVADCVLWALDRLFMHQTVAHSDVEIVEILHRLASEMDQRPEFRIVSRGVYTSWQEHIATNIALKQTRAHQWSLSSQLLDRRNKPWTLQRHITQVMKYWHRTALPMGVAVLSIAWEMLRNYRYNSCDDADGLFGRVTSDDVVAAILELTEQQYLVYDLLADTLQYIA